VKFFTGAVVGPAVHTSVTVAEVMVVLVVAVAEQLILFPDLVQD
jgi:hypothetical protein